MAKKKIRFTVIAEPSFCLNDVCNFLNSNLEHIVRTDPCWDDKTWWDEALDAFVEYRSDYDHIATKDEVAFLKAVGHEAKRRRYGMQFNEYQYDENAYEDA